MHWITSFLPAGAAQVILNGSETGTGECPMATLARQLRDYRLTTARITYHLPDHPSLLQEYIWQDYDLAPDYPVLKRFLTFWERSLDGRLHSVSVASAELITPGRVRPVDKLYRLH